MLLLITLGCTSTLDDGPLDDSAVTDDSSSTDDSAAEGNPCVPREIDVPESGIYGTVTTEDGGAVQCLRAQFCKQSCTVGASNADGQFSIESNEAGVGAFEIFPLSDDYADYFVAHTFWDNEAGATANVDVVLQKVEGGWKPMPATATSTDMGEGLTVTLGADNLSFPLGADPDLVGAAVVPENQLLPLTDFPEDKTIVVAYTLSPFDAHASSGMDWSIDHAGLQDGMSYEVWEMKLDVAEFVYEWTSLGSVTATGTTIEGSGLTYLTTLIVVEQ